MYCILVAKTQEEIERCFPVMSQLRPHIQFSEFFHLVQGQMENGYNLVYLKDDQNVLAVTGFRISTNLAWGKFLYVDDLVTDEKNRSKGVGKCLFQWLIKEAKKQGCLELHLDSGIQRKDAHRFYENLGFKQHGYSYYLTF